MPWWAPPAGVGGHPPWVVIVAVLGAPRRRWRDEAGEHRALVLTLAYCGIRWGEAVALRVRDIEFLRRRLSIHENAVQLGVDHAVGAAKGRKARSVPVPTFVLDGLAALCTGKAGDALVFTGRDGGGYLPRPKSAGGWFAAAVKRAGVQPITPHDLRHTCASLSVSAGGQRFGATADARTHIREGHARHLQRSIR